MGISAIIQSVEQDASTAANEVAGIAGSVEKTALGVQAQAHTPITITTPTATSAGSITEGSPTMRAAIVLVGLYLLWKAL